MTKKKSSPKVKPNLKSFKGIPKKIRVSVNKYDVELKKEVYLKKNQTTECYGVCNSTEKTIELSTSYPNHNVSCVLLHELLHALYYEYDLENRTPEEKVVSILSTGLTNLFVDNPKLLEYFIKEWRAK